VRISFEVREEDKVTTYSADLSKWEDSTKRVVTKIESFLKDTFSDVFKKEVFTKEK
jgi:Txe/YoeB family toxin of Txe-Axe toxin-antitoxin module